jgi:hypothetical protein
MEGRRRSAAAWLDSDLDEQRIDIDEPACFLNFPAGATKFPARANEFPAPPKKFPAQLFREFGWKPLNLLADWAPKQPKRPEKHRNSLQIPC